MAIIMTQPEFKALPEEEKCAIVYNLNPEPKPSEAKPEPKPEAKPDPKQPLAEPSQWEIADGFWN